MLCVIYGLIKVLELNLSSTKFNSNNFDDDLPFCNILKVFKYNWSLPLQIVVKENKFIELLYIGKQYPQYIFYELINNFNHNSRS